MSQLEINELFIEELQDLIERDKKEDIARVLERMFPYDIAVAFEDLSLEEALYLTSLMEVNQKVEVLAELPSDMRERFLSGYTPDEIANEFIEHMDSDDAVDVLSELSPERSRQIITSISDQEYSRNLVKMLRYPKDVAGGLMARELIKVNIHWNVSQCTEEIRKQAEEVNKVYTVYVVDDDDTLLGYVSLKRIILERTNTLVSQIYDDNIVYATVYMHGDEVSSVMKKYDVIALPVVDGLGRLVGRITIDDMVDFMQEEADKDYQMLSGLSGTVEYDDKVWILSKARLPWLVIGLAGGIASSLVIGNYEDTLLKNFQLAFFMPLVAAMGGNAGVQSSSIIVQALANQTLDDRNILKRLGKEFLVALLNGLVCSALLLSYNLFTNHTNDITVIVSTALLSVIIFASLMGTLVPLVLDRFKIDPALATGPFITTSNDLIGLLLYFAIGNALLGSI